MEARAPRPQCGCRASEAMDRAQTSPGWGDLPQRLRFQGFGCTAGEAGGLGCLLQCLLPLCWLQACPRVGGASSLAGWHRPGPWLSPARSPGLLTTLLPKRHDTDLGAAALRPSCPVPWSWAKAAVGQGRLSRGGMDQLPLPRWPRCAGSPATGPGGWDRARLPWVAQLEPMQLGLALSKKFQKS